MEQRVAAKARPRAAKRKLVPREVQPDYVGPSLTGSQELRRLFAVKPAIGPPLAQEDFPRLTRAEPTLGMKADTAHLQGRHDLGPRPRSRSPRRSVWVGTEGSHREAGPTAKGTWLETLSDRQKAHR
eukprot:1255910-Heterocapsa_arctica.AAC.1